MKKTNISSQFPSIILLFATTLACTQKPVQEGIKHLFGTEAAFCRSAFGVPERPALGLERTDFRRRH